MEQYPAGSSIMCLVMPWHLAGPGHPQAQGLLHTHETGSIKFYEITCASRSTDRGKLQMGDQHWVCSESVYAITCVYWKLWQNNILLSGQCCIYGSPGTLWGQGIHRYRDDQFHMHGTISTLLICGYWKCSRTIISYVISSECVDGLAPLW